MDMKEWWKNTFRAMVKRKSSQRKRIWNFFLHLHKNRARPGINTIFVVRNQKYKTQCKRFQHKKRINLEWSDEVDERKREELVQQMCSFFFFFSFFCSHILCCSQYVAKLKWRLLNGKWAKLYYIMLYFVVIRIRHKMLFLHLRICHIFCFILFIFFFHILHKIGKIFENVMQKRENVCRTQP